MLFGGYRLGPRMWFWASFLVVFGAHFSALWILMANSWMQTPQGFVTQPTQWGNARVHDELLPTSCSHHRSCRACYTRWVASWMIGAALVMSRERLVPAEEASP